MYMLCTFKLYAYNLCDIHIHNVKKALTPIILETIPYMANSPLYLFSKSISP